MLIFSGIQVLKDRIINKLETSYDNPLVKVAILIPSTTRHVNNTTLTNLSLIKYSLKSILKTIEPTYTYKIYIGIDKGDYLETVKEKIESMSTLSTSSTRWYICKDYECNCRICTERKHGVYIFY